MIVSILPILIPILVGIGIGLLWRFTMGKPFNNWVICLCIAVIAFFNFTVCATITALAIIAYQLLFKKKDSTKTQDE